MAVAESTHWYDKRGAPCYTVIGGNGKERPTTLRDARKLNLVPSVTTIIKVAAAPGLENWKVDQALMSALTLPKFDNESLDDFMRRAKSDSKRQAIQAAERGTEIHADIESGFNGGPETPVYKRIMAFLQGVYFTGDWKAEESFCHVKGFGGKIDLYSPNGIVVDFKTKDNLEGKDPKKLVYDEHGMQLSAYAMGLDFKDPERVSIFIDRGNPEIVCTYIWPKESHEKHSNMFLNLLDYWQLSKGYVPDINYESTH